MATSFNTDSKFVFSPCFFFVAILAFACQFRIVSAERSGMSLGPVADRPMIFFAENSTDQLANKPIQQLRSQGPDFKAVYHTLSELTEVCKEDGYRIGRQHVFKKGGRNDGHGCVDKRGDRQGQWQSIAGSSSMWLVNYLDGKRSGPAVNYWPNCVIESVGRYQDDMRHGIWFEYRKNANLRRQLHFDTGRENGLYRYFSKSGKLIEKGQMRDGKREGRFTYTFSNGKQWFAVDYDHGSVLHPEAKACRKKKGRWHVDLDAFELGCMLPTGAEGEWKKWHDDGQLAWRSSYHEGLKHGESFEYSRTGALKTQGSYRDGIPYGLHQWFDKSRSVFMSTNLGQSATGQWKRHTDDGKIEELGDYKDGKREGLWVSYFAGGERPKEELSFEDDQTSGPYRHYYPTGELMIEGQFSLQGRTGLWRGYFPSGQSAWTGHFSRNEKSGEWRAWYPSGQLKSVAHYQSDNKAGESIVYSKEGRATLRENYRLGKKHGLSEQFFENGRLWLHASYKDGFRTDSEEPLKCEALGGKWSVLADTREMGCKRCFPGREADRVFGMTAKDPPLPKQIWDGRFASWYDSGTIQVMGRYVEGKKIGPWLRYFENGKLLSRGEYLEGRLSGPWVGYYSDGKKRTAGSYIAGQPIGRWQSISRDGASIVRREYTDDEHAFNEGSLSEESLADRFSTTDDRLLFGQYESTGEVKHLLKYEGTKNLKGSDSTIDALWSLYLDDKLTSSGTDKGLWDQFADWHLSAKAPSKASSTAR